MDYGFKCGMPWKWVRKFSLLQTHFPSFTLRELGFPLFAIRFCNVGLIWLRRQRFPARYLCNYDKHIEVLAYPLWVLALLHLFLPNFSLHCLMLTRITIFPLTPPTLSSTFGPKMECVPFLLKLLYKLFYEIKYKNKGEITFSRRLKTVVCRIYHRCFCIGKGTKWMHYHFGYRAFSLCFLFIWGRNTEDTMLRDKIWEDQRGLRHVDTTASPSFSPVSSKLSMFRDRTGVTNERMGEGWSWLSPGFTNLPSEMVRGRRNDVMTLALVFLTTWLK